MATTKKSTKAKTKTSKKSSTNKSKSTKSIKQSASTSAIKQRFTKKPHTKYTVVEQLRRLNIFSGVVALLLAGAAGFFMDNTSYQIFTSMLTKDQLASTTNTVFVPAIHVIYDIELRWVVVAVLLISAILPLLAATRNRKSYETALANKIMLWRWIDTAVVGALMTSIVALISGVQDLVTLKVTGILVIITSMLGWLAERRNAGTSKSTKSDHWLSTLTGLVPLIIIAVYAYGTVVYGLVRSPWYVYALYAATIVVFLGYAKNQKRGAKGLQTYEQTERKYIQLGICAKVVFAVILIVGLYKK